MAGMSPDPDIAPHEVWQRLYPPGSFDPARPDGHAAFWPGTLPDGRQILQPIRALPGDGGRGVASLIVNQAGFAVVDALADLMAGAARLHAPEVIVGVPTLGLGLAEGVARRLGHGRYAALGTSRKFWYDEGLSVPLRSVTSPGEGQKRLYLDPRLRPLLAGRRVLVVDDVLSTGQSLASALALLDLAGVRPVAAVFAMLQGPGWRAAGVPVAGAFATPLLQRRESGRWVAAD
jgi:adenine/guanine phosphoribosyltransferase-like PRPP-binding protein